jgi:hypothetical protein
MIYEMTMNLPNPDFEIYGINRTRRSRYEYLKRSVPGSGFKGYKRLISKLMYRSRPSQPEAAMAESARFVVYKKR